MMAENLIDNNSVLDYFREIRAILDEKYDKAERIHKISRDVTIESKRIIFRLHAFSRNPKVIREAEERIRSLESNCFLRIAKELENEDSNYFVRNYTNGLQEFIEALSFWHYLKNDDIISHQEVQERLSFRVKLNVQNKRAPDDSQNNETEADDDQYKILSIYVPQNDYMLGLLDLTGELMRKCVSSVTEGKDEIVFNTCRIVQGFLAGITGIHPIRRNFNDKLRELRRSLDKMERCCYNLKIRDTYESMKPMKFAVANDDQEAHYDSGLE